MAYNNWKLMDKITVAVKSKPGYRGFTGFIVDAGDEKAIETAKDWARERDYDSEKREYTTVHEPNVHTFDNKGFTATILQSAGGSSQGGRLSFWSCKVEKDGVEFTIGVNDAVLADLIRSSDISNGTVKQKVMFARKGGQPGLIHEGMDSYKDATADMAHKAVMKSAKKTSKWEIGGVYSSITMTDICLGEVWDTMEEYQETYSKETGYWGSYERTRTSLRKAKTPKKVLMWTHLSDHRHKDGAPKTLEEFLKVELDDNYFYFSAGKPPARAKTNQLEVKETDMKLIDEFISKARYSGDGRYVREIK